MEAKKMARKIEEHFFTKENKLNASYWYAFQKVTNLKEYRNEFTEKSITKIKTILNKLGIVYEVGKRKYGNATNWWIELEVCEYNKLKHFNEEYHKYKKFAKEINLEHKYTDDVIIDYLADGIYCNV